MSVTFTPWTVASDRPGQKPTLSVRRVLSYYIGMCMNILESFIVAGLVIIVVIASYTFIAFRARKRVEEHLTDPEEILVAVKIYESYKRKGAAIRLLKKGLEKNPDHPGLQQRLDALEHEDP